MTEQEYLYGVLEELRRFYEETAAPYIERLMELNATHIPAQDRDALTARNRELGAALWQFGAPHE